MSLRQRRFDELPNFQRRSFLKRGALIQFGLGVGMLSHGSARAQNSVADTVKALTFDVFGTVVDWRTSIIREGQILAANKGFDLDGRIC